MRVRSTEYMKVSSDRWCSLRNRNPRFLCSLVVENRAAACHVGLEPTRVLENGVYSKPSRQITWRTDWNGEQIEGSPFGSRLRRCLTAGPTILKAKAKQETVPDHGFMVHLPQRRSFYHVLLSISALEVDNLLVRAGE